MRTRVYGLLFLCCFLVVLLSAIPTVESSLGFLVDPIGSVTDSIGYLIDKIENLSHRLLDRVDVFIKELKSNTDDSIKKLFEHLHEVLGRIFTEVNSLQGLIELIIKMLETRSISVGGDIANFVNVLEKFGNQFPVTVHITLTKLQQLLDQLARVPVKETKDEIVIELNGILNTILDAVDLRAQSTVNTTKAGYMEIHRAINEFKSDIIKMANHVSSDEFLTLLLRNWTTFVDKAMYITSKNPAMASLTSVLNEFFQMWEKTTQIISIALLTLLAITSMVVLKISFSTKSKIYATINMAIYIPTIIILGTLIAPYVTKVVANECPEVMTLIETFPLSLNTRTVDKIRQLPGPLFVISESGYFGTGKSTTLCLFYHTLSKSKSLKCPCFDARTKTSDNVSEGKTRGVRVMAIPRSNIPVDQLPVPMQDPFKKMEASSNEGTILLVDTQGTNDGDAPTGESELLELITIILSTHHTFGRSSRYYDKSGLEKMAHIARLISMTQILSVNRCGSTLNSSLKKFSSPQFTIRVMDSIDGPRTWIKCAQFTENGILEHIPNGCNMLIPVLNSELVQLISKRSHEEQELLNNCFNNAKVLLLPSAERRERDALLSFSSNPHKILEFYEGKEQGVAYSLVHHHFPDLLTSPPKKVFMIESSINKATIIDGNDLVDYLTASFGALQTILEKYNDLLSSYSVSGYQQSIIKLLDDILNKWNIDHIINKLPIIPKGEPLNEEMLCPTEETERLFFQSVTSLNQSLCSLQSLLSTTELNEFNKRVELKINGGLNQLREKLESTCRYEWKIDEWNECVGVCNGKQTRTIQCLQSYTRDIVSDQFCILFTKQKPIIERECESQKFSFEWISPKEEDFSTGCSHPQPCKPKIYPESDIIPKNIMAGENKASYWCQQCKSIRVKDEECIKAIGPKPADLSKRCYPNQRFWTSAGYLPSNSECECGSLQHPQLACENCYGDVFLLQDCRVMGSINVEQYSRKCEGYRWRLDGTTKCSSLTCGFKYPNYQCYSCNSETPVDNKYCNAKEKPHTPPTICNEIYGWKYDNWPGPCKCGSKLTRSVTCVSLCESGGRVVDSHLCRHLQRPDTCTCPPCPKREQDFIGSNVFPACLENALFVEVKANIDGLDVMTIKHNQVSWEHKHFQTANGITINGIPMEWTEKLTLPQSTFGYSLAYFKVIEARHTVYVMQQPSLANSWELKVVFDDDPRSGRATYRCEIAFIPNSPTHFNHPKLAPPLIRKILS